LRLIKIRDFSFIDPINYNSQVKKHKTSKISIIIDNFDNPISIGATENRRFSFIKNPKDFFVN